MDVYNEDFLAFWRALNNEAVKYIMVGGFATNLHGYQRTTQDMDILLDDTAENRKKFRRAFEVYSGCDYYMIETLQFVPGWSPFKLNNGFVLDILLTPMKGLEPFSFDDCHNAASVATIYEIEVPFLQINQLIANKKAVNRSKDQVDVIELERIKQLRIEMGLD